MKAVFLSFLILCLATIDTTAQINPCQIYNIILDSTYKREFSYYDDSLRKGNDYVDVTVRQPDVEMKNRKLMVEQHFLYIWEKSIPFEEIDINQWFNSAPIKKDTKRKHIPSLITDMCKFNNDLNYKILDKEHFSIDFKEKKVLKNGLKLPVIRVYLSDIITYNKENELITYISYNSRERFKNMTHTATYAIKMKLIKGTWAITECRINWGND